MAQLLQLSFAVRTAKELVLSYITLHYTEEIVAFFLIFDLDHLPTLYQAIRDIF